MKQTHPCHHGAGWLLGFFLLATAAHAQPPSLDFKLDHFGYRPDDPKMAVATMDPGASVEIRDLSGTVVYRVPEDGGAITSRGFDPIRSGDSVWWIEFDDFDTPGTYRLHSASLGASYPFDIADDVYDEAVRTAARAFSYQRCGTPKTTAHAGAWADETACHTSDSTTSAAPGQVDRGTLDLSGGWHDAGDYNKYVWTAVSDAIWSLLTAFEDNPGAFVDGDLNLPESGNGLPDLLDEVRWELDWLLTMQRPNGAVLGRMREPNFESGAPPSTDTATRFYFDPTHESAAVFVGSTALAARIFAQVGETAYAATLADAARATWQWLAAQPEDSDIEVWAAAELYRLDPTQTAARAYVDGYTNWSTLFYEIDSTAWRAVAAYLRTPGATVATTSAMRVSMGVHVDRIFGWNDLYRAGMVDYQYYWGSNRPRALYGLFLLQAAALGTTGSYSADECRGHARDFLHFLHGRNTLNMLYLSNMAALGGEHSSFQIYHAWFGDSDDAFSTASYLGKPGATVEPAYPYFGGVDNHGISDDKTSTLGPAPGFVPGGPNDSYADTTSGGSSPPLGAVYKDRFYRDWADQTVPSAVTWEITEPSISYQGPYVALGTYFMKGSRAIVLFEDDFETGGTAAWDVTVGAD